MYMRQDRYTAQDRRDDRGLGDLFNELKGEVSRLISKEMEMLRLEMSQKTGRLTEGVIYLVAGGLIGYAGFLALSLALIMLLAIWLPNWASGLIVAVAWGGIAFWLVQEGRKALSGMDLMPRRTLETLKEFDHAEHGEHTRAA